MTEQNSIDFNSYDFTINSGAFDLNDAVAKSVSSDSGTATPSGHSFSIEGSDGISTSASGSTITVSGSGVSSIGGWTLLTTSQV